MSIIPNESKSKKEPKLIKLKLEQSQEFKDAQSRQLKTSSYYIVTSEQNESKLHYNFYNNLLAYAKFLDAEVINILLRYENPTSIWTNRQKSTEKWNAETKPYQTANRQNIHKYLTVLADTKVRPTSKYPLRGLANMVPEKCTIVGATKLHLESLPVLDGSPQKILLTTGCITEPNYTDSAIGAMGKNAHKLGFVIVEVRDEEVFFIRQVEGIYNPGQADDGTFTDLCYSVENQEVTKVTKAKGIVFGDTHYPELDTRIDKKNDEMATFFNVDNVVFHDVIDGESVNNWIQQDPVEQYKRFAAGRHLIKKEFSILHKWLKTKLKFNPIVPQANHNDRFDRYLSTNDWRRDIPNALEYMKYLTATLTGKAERGVVAYFIENAFGKKVKCLAHDESFKMGKFEVGVHGHIGSNGSRGSKLGFCNLNIPMVSAHGHYVFRADDCLVVGTNTKMKLGYNKGASSWVQSNVIIHENNTAQHIIFIQGEYTTFNIN